MKQLVFEDKKIFYKAEGKGKPVVLLHGFAEDSNVWNHQLKELRERFYVIIPDLPGSGKSELLEGDLSIENYAEVIKAIADVEIAGRGNESEKNLFTLIGHSMGGYITLAFAQKYPWLLNAFGLFHSTAYADDTAKKDTRRKGIEFIRTNGAASFLKATTPNLFSEKTKKERPELVEELIGLSEGFLPESLIQYYDAMIQRPDRTSVLESFPRPILFMIGKYDTAVPLKASLEQCSLPPVSHIHILQASAHMGMWEEKDAATDFLLNFLIRCSQSAQ